MFIFLFQSVMTVERDTWIIIIMNIIANIIIIIIINTHYNLFISYPWHYINIVPNSS